MLHINCQNKWAWNMAPLKLDYLYFDTHCIRIPHYWLHFGNLQRLKKILCRESNSDLWLCAPTPYLWTTENPRVMQRLESYCPTYSFLQSLLGNVSETGELWIMTSRVLLLDPNWIHPKWIHVQVRINYNNMWKTFMDNTNNIGNSL